MRVITALSLSAAGLALAACAPPEPAYETQTLAAPTCDASLFEGLKGEPIEIVDSVNTDLVVRVLAADAFVPRDFDRNRLTFTTSPGGTVSRIFCG
ncbi:MAG: hypothetical protein KDA50_01470 [Rhodobacteraceae bacterium]|nr:hypothetical protein [Paracoccaceae bacterium]